MCWEKKRKCPNNKTQKIRSVVVAHMIAGHRSLFVNTAASCLWYYRTEACLLTLPLHVCDITEQKLRRKTANSMKQSPFCDSNKFKKTSAFYGTWRFITVFAARHLSHSWEPDESNPLRAIFVADLRLRLTSRRLPSGCQNEAVRFVLCFLIYAKKSSENCLKLYSHRFFPRSSGFKDLWLYSNILRFFFCGAATQCGSWPPNSWGF
jgi:hypothetical protein